jgi:HAE1 family hydrophobic/amphiphilic exporter-1
MHEVGGPIIAIALVLVAVFVPLAFISGLTGQFYKQFALTIAISTVISADRFADAVAGAGRCCC